MGQLSRLYKPHNRSHTLERCYHQMIMGQRPKEPPRAERIGAWEPKTRLREAEASECMHACPHTHVHTHVKVQA